MIVQSDTPVPELRRQLLLLWRQVPLEEREKLLLMLAEELSLDQILAKLQERQALVERADPDGSLRAAAIRFFLVAQAGLNPAERDPRPVLAEVSDDFFRELRITDDE